MTSDVFDPTLVPDIVDFPTIFDLNLSIKQSKLRVTSNSVPPIPKTIFFILFPLTRYCVDKEVTRTSKLAVHIPVGRTEKDYTPESQAQALRVCICNISRIHMLHQPICCPFDNAPADWSSIYPHLLSPVMPGTSSPRSKPPAITSLLLPSIPTKAFWVAKILVDLLSL